MEIENLKIEQKIGQMFIIALEEKENKGGYQRRVSSSFPSINRPKIGR